MRTVTVTISRALSLHLRTSPFPHTIFVNSNYNFIKNTYYGHFTILSPRGSERLSNLYEIKQQVAGRLGTWTCVCDWMLPLPSTEPWGLLEECH